LILLSDKTTKLISSFRKRSNPSTLNPVNPKTPISIPFVSKIHSSARRKAYPVITYCPTSMYLTPLPNTPERRQQKLKEKLQNLLQLRVEVVFTNN
jgi:hypothetical protein